LLRATAQAGQERAGSGGGGILRARERLYAELVTGKPRAPQIGEPPELATRRAARSRLERDTVNG